MSVRPCLDCGKPTSNGARCPTDEARRVRERSRRRGTRQQQGYGTDHQRLRREVIAAQPWCSNCGATTRLSLDHVTPKRQGGPTDRANADVLCVPCNSAKRDR